LLLFRLSSFFNRFRITRLLRFHSFIYRLNQFLCNVDISPGASIGKNFLMPHASGIVIGDTAVIGNDVTLMHNVTIGTRRLGEAGKRHATIGDNVFIGPNTVILGNIVIGDNAQIGSNSVVLTDVGSDEKIWGIHK